MERDDLRAALDDLASQVAPLHEDASPAVRERGRQRRRRRNGVVTGLTSAALIAVLFTGIGIAGHRQTPRIATEGPPTTTTIGTSTPPVTTEVCTEADASAYGGISMPTPTRVTKTRVFKSVFARLDPPPVSVQPKVPASVAWAGTKSSTYRVATYEIVLGSYSAFVPSKGGVPENWHRLTWAVIGRHVPSFLHEGGGFTPESGVTTKPRPVCFFTTQLFLFDANTGQELEQLTFGG